MRVQLKNLPPPIVSYRSSRLRYLSNIIPGKDVALFSSTMVRDQCVTDSWGYVSANFFALTACCLLFLIIMFLKSWGLFDPSSPHLLILNHKTSRTPTFFVIMSVYDVIIKKNTPSLPEPQIHPAQPLITHTFTTVCLKKNNNNNLIFLPEKFVASPYWWAQSILTTNPTVLFCSRLPLTLKNISPSCLFYYSVFLKVNLTKWCQCLTSLWL